MTKKLSGKKHLAIVMYKVINNKAPGYLIDRFEKKATVVMRYVRVKVDFSPNITLNLLKAVDFLLLGQKYGTPSHIILELVPLSLLLKNK